MEYDAQKKRKEGGKKRESESGTQSFLYKLLCGKPHYHNL